jgi:hypothetical protein
MCYMLRPSPSFGKNWIHLLRDITYPVNVHSTRRDNLVCFAVRHVPLLSDVLDK